MSYYTELGSHIRDEVIVVLFLTNYVTKNELKHATGIETSDFVQYSS